ncbi:MAG: hypothetical protein ACRBBS_03400 [Thalassovita sp.]
MRLHALVADPTKTLPILEVLRDDPSEYVRRFVVNHLNGIAKDHPDLVANIARNWMMHASKDREKLIRHACRSLVKQGHSATLAVFGVLPPAIGMPQIEINPRKVVLGDALTFDVTFSSTSAKPQKLIIDYAIHHCKANGTLVPKVFKWKQSTLSSNETRRHPMRPITTRAYCPGDHAVSLRINGQDFGRAQFELEM